MEPRNITAGIGMDVHFNCKHTGTLASPFWNITYPNGASRTVSTARLPHYHFSTGMGLLIRDVDETHNMTSYACMFRIYDRNELIIISSKAGTLIVLENIRFDLQLRDSNGFEISTTTRSLELFQGDSLPFITIKKFGYSADTFIVIVRITKTFDDDHNNTCEIIHACY